jgi:hypothetical protein
VEFSIRGDDSLDYFGYSWFFGGFPLPRDPIIMVESLMIVTSLIPYSRSIMIP